MKIADFYTELKCAIKYTKLYKCERSKNPELKYMDENIKKAIKYIRKKYKNPEEQRNKELTEDEIDEFIIADYMEMKEITEANSFMNNYIMLFFALKYLEEHKDEIPKLSEEVEERKIIFQDTMTDNFHENLLRAVSYLESSCTEYVYKYIERYESDYIAIVEDIQKYGEKIAFVRYCDNCLKCNMMNISMKRTFMNIAYTVIFGIKGIDEKALPKNDKALNYKNKYKINGYIYECIEVVKKTAKECLANALHQVCNKLSDFDYFSEAQEIHKSKMEYMGLPGLIYNLNDKNSSYNPSIKKMLSYEELKELDINELIRMSSFYNNKLAKQIKSYSLALFYLKNKGLLEEIIEDKVTEDEIELQAEDKELDNIYIKYVLLTSVIKRFLKEKREYFSKQDISNWIQSLKYNEGKHNEREIYICQMPINVKPLIKDVKEKWKNKYNENFNKSLPEKENNLEKDLMFASLLYVPIFNSYIYKDIAIKTELASMLDELKDNPKDYKNFGIELEYDKKGDRIDISNLHNVVISSDGKTGINREHIQLKELSDFVKSYTGSSLVRVYEGSQDLEFTKGRIKGCMTTQLLLPYTKAQIKYLKDVSNGNYKTERKTINSVTEYNNRYLQHVLYCMGEEKNLSLYTNKVTTLKKGKAIIEEYPRIRYLDLDKNILYEQDLKGNLKKVEEREER